MNIKLVLVLLLLMYSWDVKAQHAKQKSNTISGEGFTKTLAEEPKDFSAYILRNMIYPKEALKNKREGIVTVELVVEKDGSTSNARILKGKDIGCGIPEEALRLIAASPKWKAATVNSTPVRSYYTVQIKFSLSKNSFLSDTEGVYLTNDPNPEIPISRIKNTNEHEVFDIVEVAPEPSFNQKDFFVENLRYPDQARENNIQGRITVGFVVERDGSITNVKVVKGGGLGHGIPEEAIRVVKAMPKWKPGMHKGKIVRTNYTIPLHFALQ